MERSSSLIPRTYTEIIQYNEDKDTQWIECSLRLVSKDSSSQWHVKVTFKGMLQSNSGWLQRKKDFENLCRSLDFGHCPLLNNTVTELTLSNLLPEPHNTFPRIVNNLRTILRKHIAITSPLRQNTYLTPCNTYTRIRHNMRIILQENIAIASPLPQNVHFKSCNTYPRVINNMRIILRENIAIALPLLQGVQPEASNMYARLLYNLQITLREDPTRVRFPLYSDQRVPTRDFTLLKKERELAAGVHLVCVDSKLYVFKEIARPLYEPADTEVLLQELQNLQILRGVRGIVQLVAVVTSSNPYQTFETGQSGSTVVRGLLLEHYPNGTLRDALLSSDLSQPWKQWASQLASALQQMHNYGLTHMDVKPSNIVISANFETTLIDISGRAYSQEWLSPELSHQDDPLSQDISLRVQNDTWAFGKIVSRMANASEFDNMLLQGIASNCTAPVSERMSLSNAITRLAGGVQEV